MWPDRSWCPSDKDMVLAPGPSLLVTQLPRVTASTGADEGFVAMAASQRPLAASERPSRLPAPGLHLRGSWVRMAHILSSLDVTLASAPARACLQSLLPESPSLHGHGLYPCVDVSVCLTPNFHLIKRKLGSKRTHRSPLSLASLRGCGV